MKDDVLKVLQHRDPIDALLLTQKQLQSLTEEEIEALRRLVFKHRWARLVWEQKIEPVLSELTTRDKTNERSSS